MFIIYGRHVIQERIGFIMLGLCGLPLLAPPASATSDYAPWLPLGTPLRLERPLDYLVFNQDSILIVFIYYLRGITLLP